jgi:hypothetical protein
VCSRADQAIKQRPEMQSKAAGNELGRADCGYQRTGADRRDSCARHDSAPVVLATGQHRDEIIHRNTHSLHKWKFRNDLQCSVESGSVSSKPFNTVITLVHLLASVMGERLARWQDD